MDGLLITFNHIIYEFLIETLFKLLKSFQEKKKIPNHTKMLG